MKTMPRPIHRSEGHLVDICMQLHSDKITLTHGSTENVGMCVLIGLGNIQLYLDTEQNASSKGQNIASKIYDSWIADLLCLQWSW